MRDLIAPQPPRLPLLEQMPRVMVLLSHDILNLAEINELIDVLGAHPHMHSRATWLDFLIRTPRDRFPGGPLWYQYVGLDLTRVNDAYCDEAGLPVGRRLVSPGEKIAVQTWKYVGMSNWQRCEDPTAPAPPKLKKANHAQPRP